MNGITGKRKPSQPTVPAPMPYIQSQPSPERESHPGNPPVKVLMDGYNGGIGAGEDRQRSHPQSPSRPRSSVLPNIKDPVAIHLLVQTALGDSQEFEVLSFEEIDQLKKEHPAILNRIQALKRKLAMETKVREAAESISRLDGPDAAQRRSRRSMGSSRNSTDELMSSRIRCEELAMELWKLEKRATEIQRRLLHHTAGILQMTHPANAVKNQGLNGNLPGSPESMYAGSNSRSSMTLRDDVDGFDDRSLYRPMEGLEDFGGTSKESAAAIATTEAKIEELNQRLRDVIAQVNPEYAQSYDVPPSRQQNGASGDPVAGLNVQLDFLERSISSVRSTESTNEERLEDFNSRLHQLATEIGSTDVQHLGPPPQAPGQGLQVQYSYLGQILHVIQQHLIGSSGGADTQDKLRRLWDVLLAGEEERKARGSQDESREPSTREDFSVDAFSTKVQWLCSRASSMMEEKDVLRRQIQQQRELNNKSDSAKDAERQQLLDEVQNKTQELTRTRQEHDFAVKELEGKREDVLKLESQLHELSDDQGIAHAELQGRLEETQSKMTSLEREIQEASSRRDEAVASETTVRSQFEEKSKELDRVNGEMENLESEVVRLQTEVTVARAELDGAYGTRAQRAAEVASNPAMQKEMEDLGERNRALTHELEALKSEKEATGGNSSDMQRQVQTLKSELAETIEEYENMTKQSIEAEKDREQLESTIDGLRERCEGLDSQLAEEKVRMMGVKSPPPGGSTGSGPVESTSTATLKAEFKKMMRDTRAENMKTLRAEQEERRKLEGIIRTLKKEQGSRKSALSQSVTA